MRKVRKFFKHLHPIFIILPLVVIVTGYIGLTILRDNGYLPQKTIFPTGVRYVADQMMVRYKDGNTPDDLAAENNVVEQKQLQDQLSSLGVSSQKKLFDSKDSLLKNYYLLTLKKGVSIPGLYERLKYVPEIENATPDYVLKIQETPNDPYFPQMWNLQNINITSAWDSVHTNKRVTVAVIDTGVDYNHEDLQGVVIKGKNFISGNQNPMDDQGHGTHVAGILGAVTNNGIGISGVSWGANVLAIKACDVNGDCNTTNVARAIQYAVDHGAKIINISIAGAGSCNGTYTSMLSYAAKKKVLVIAAAGNGNNGDSVGVDANSQIPAGCSNVLAVGSLTAQNTRSTFSNFGSHVKISASGGQSPCTMSSCVLSTAPDNGYKLRAGTSMAAPLVSGAAALLLSYNSKLTVGKIITCLINSGDAVQTDYPIGPRLNPARALTVCAPNATITPTPTPIVLNSSGSISGTVFVDKNNNGYFESREKTFPGAQVVLSGLTSDSVIANTRGRYIFPNLSPGLYTISLAVNGQSVGTPINVTLVSKTSSVLLNLAVPLDIAVSPTPTGVQKTAGQCFLDPECLKGNKSVQICSFQCTP